MVCIFWKTATQKLHTISDLAGIFPTESEAVAFGLQAGKDWIDSQPAAAKDLNKSEFVQCTDNEPAINDLMFRYHPGMTRTSGFQSGPLYGQQRGENAMIVQSAKLASLSRY